MNPIKASVHMDIQLARPSSRICSQSRLPARSEVIIGLGEHEGNTLTGMLTNVTCVSQSLSIVDVRVASPSLARSQLGLPAPANFIIGLSRKHKERKQITFNNHKALVIWMAW